MVLQAEGKCFRRQVCAAARFEEWIAGPYPPPRGAPGSVWRATDQSGETVFIWWDDTGGPHEAHPGVPKWNDAIPFDAEVKGTGALEAFLAGFIVGLKARRKFKRS